MTLHFRHPQGNTLVEYILPAGIVGLVLVTAATVLGPNIKTASSHVVHGQSVKNQSIVTVTGLGNGISPAVAKTLEMGAQFKTIGMTLKLADGSTVALPAFPQDLKQSVESVGGNGTTQFLLANLDALREQLLQEGKLTPEQDNLLKALSSQGHYIAGAEAAMENPAKTTGSSSAYGSSTIVYDGHGAEPIEFSLRLMSGMGYYPDNNPNGTTYSSVTGISPQAAKDLHMEGAISMGNDTLKFAQIYSTALEQGAMDDPAVRSVIQTLTQNVLDIADQTGKAGDYTANEYFYEQPQFSNYTPGNFNQNVAAPLTHTNSAAICQTGGGQDSGIQCH